MASLPVLSNLQASDQYHILIFITTENRHHIELSGFQNISIRSEFSVKSVFRCFYTILACTKSILNSVKLANYSKCPKTTNEN